MNDPANPASPPPRPKNGQARLRPNPAGAPRRPISLSHESRFIGYLVLGLGVIAVISVLILAFSGGVDTNEPLPDPTVTANLQSGLSKDAGKVAEAGNTKALSMSRQKGIDAGDLAGGWQASIGDYVAVMQISKGLFQIIMAHPNAALPRLYSSGSYSMIDDIVVLQPRGDWKAPAVAPGSGIKYERLTRGQYPMIVGFKDGTMVWQNVPQGETRTYVPPRSPLLLNPDKDYIVWKKLD